MRGRSSGVHIRSQREEGDPWVILWIFCVCVLVGRGVRCAWPEVPTPRPTSELAYTPQHPFTLLGAHECKSQERRGGSQPSSQNIGYPPGFGGPHARET